MTLEKVTPINPAAGYIGGKRNLAKRICAIIQDVDHDGYAEPFVGMGGIFFRRAARPRAESINDISGDVTTLFRVVRRHYQAFVDEMEWLLASRAEFERLRAIDPATLTDIERAARYLYLQRLAFGGKVASRNFGVDSRTPARFNLARLRATLAAIRDRLQPVVIEQLPYADFIRRYDRPGMLFYLDPPYWNCEDDYGAGIFDRAYSIGQISTGWRRCSAGSRANSLSRSTIRRGCAPPLRRSTWPRWKRPIRYRRRRPVARSVRVS